MFPSERLVFPSHYSQLNNHNNNWYRLNPTPVVIVVTFPGYAIFSSLIFLSLYLRSKYVYFL